MLLDLSRIRALCFDVDGTLSDSDDVYARQYTNWIRWLPFVRRPDVLARRLVMWLESPGNAMLSLSDTVGLDGIAIPVIDWVYRHLPRRRSECLVVPGVAEMLPRLKKRYPMAVISARDQRNTMGFLDNCGLTAYFDVILTALSAHHTKPYPDPILLAAKMMGVHPAECLMIGDTTVDVRAAKAAGAQVISVLCGFGEEGELRRLGTDLIVQTTADVEQVLAGTRS
jgi:N-acetyl-D-muramate 6-phosphate phosphatase